MRGSEVKGESKRERKNVWIRGWDWIVKEGEMGNRRDKSEEEVQG